MEECTFLRPATYIFTSVSYDRVEQKNEAVLLPSFISNHNSLGIFHYFARNNEMSQCSRLKIGECFVPVMLPVVTRSGRKDGG